MSVSRSARTAGVVSAGTLALVLGGAGTALALSLPSPEPTVSQVASTANSTVQGLVGASPSPSPSTSPSPSASPAPLPQPSAIASQVSSAVTKATSTTTTPPSTGKVGGNPSGGGHGSDTHPGGLTLHRNPSGSGSRPAGSSLGGAPLLAAPVNAGTYSLAFGPVDLPYLGSLDIAGLPPDGLAPQVAPAQAGQADQAGQATPGTGPQTVRLASGDSPVAGGLPGLLVVVAVATVGAAAAAHVGVIRQRMTPPGTHAI